MWSSAEDISFWDIGLAGATTYQAIIDAERNPELFSSTGGIRPDQPGMPYMIDMDDPAHLLRRKLVNAGFTRKRVKDKEKIIKTFPENPDARVENGRWGPYIKFGKLNLKIPKGTEPEKITYEDVLKLAGPAPAAKKTTSKKVKK